MREEQIEYLQMAPFCRSLRMWRNRSAHTGPRLVLNTHELGSTQVIRDQKPELDDEVSSMSSNRIAYFYFRYRRRCYAKSS